MGYMGCVADNGGWGEDPPMPYQDGPSGGPRNNICIPCNINRACVAGRIFRTRRDQCVFAGGTIESCCATLAGL